MRVWFFPDAMKQVSEEVDLGQFVNQDHISREVVRAIHRGLSTIGFVVLRHRDGPDTWKLSRNPIV